MSHELWPIIAREQTARRTLVAATIVNAGGSTPRGVGAKMLIWPDGQTLGTVGGGAFEAAVVADAGEVINAKHSRAQRYAFVPQATPGQSQREARVFGAVCGGEVEVFLELIMPTDQLLIVGGGHCGRALAHAAALLDFEIIVADDRAEYSCADEFPSSARVLHLPPDFDGLPEADEHTYVALVSKGYLSDLAAIRKVLSSPARYIGMIGSIRKRETVFKTLREEGVSDEQLSRVHAPIGLDIGAQTPAEIAVSILAEIIRARHAKDE